MVVNAKQHQLLKIHGIDGTIITMEDIEQASQQLLDSGWTYAAIGDEVGVRWDTVRTWHLGLHSPQANQAVLLMFRALAERAPPPKRRYGPDAPQRQPKKRPG